VSYETLAQPENESRLKKVKTLMTVGGILPMIWRMDIRRPAFDASLPEHIRWVNIWARLDPADSGPIDADRVLKAKPTAPKKKDRSDPPRTWLSVSPLGDPEPGGYEDVIVSNEDDVMRDHTAYWRNGHEVAPRLVREIRGDGANAATGGFEQEEGVRALRRRLQILCVSGPRLLAWYAFPAVVTAVLAGWWTPMSVESAGTRLIIAVAMGVGVTLGAHALCWIARKTLWSRGLETFAMFSSAVPPRTEDEWKVTSHPDRKVFGVGMGQMYRE
jgi:hypothetical protein